VCCVHQCTNLDAVNLLIMGGEKECRDKTQGQITEGAAKKRKDGGDICKTAALRKRKREGGLRGSDRQKALCFARRQDDRHSHVRILPECGVICTPKPRIRAGVKDTVRIRHTCQVAKKVRSGLSKHMCRNCHQKATQFMTVVCTYTACSRSQTFCEQLHAQEGAMKSFAT